jgi:hypothetical protein
MRKTIVVFALLASLTLAACGGPSESEKYTKAVNKQVQEVGNTLISSSQLVSATSSAAQDREALASQADELRQLARDIGKLDHPSSVDAGNAELVAEINAYAQQVDEVASGGKPEGLVANTKLTVSRIKATVEQINGSL